MGKEEQKNEPANGAFTRMNYLFQAAHLMSKISPMSPLSCYYGKTVKEISKKIVEKLHPDVKRTLCTACNCPLTSESKQINVKVKPSRKKKRKKKIKSSLTNPSEGEDCEKRSEQSQNKKEFNSLNRYTKSRIEIKNKKPNRVQWCCRKCGFSKSYLQKPQYKIWIHKIFDNELSGVISEESKKEEVALPPLQ